MRGARTSCLGLGVTASALLVLASNSARAADTPSLPVANDAPCASWSHRLHAAAEVGLLMPVGLGTIFSLAYEQRPRWDFDFFWEPSNYLQSYSLGGAYHPFDRIFFVGARVRWIQLHPPFSRGFHARRDNQPALGPEIGVRLTLGRDRTFLPFASLGATFFPSATTSLPPMYTLNVGMGLAL